MLIEFAPKDGNRVWSAGDLLPSSFRHVSNQNHFIIMTFNKKCCFSRLKHRCRRGLTLSVNYSLTVNPVTRSIYTFLHLETVYKHISVSNHVWSVLSKPLAQGCTLPENQVCSCNMLPRAKKKACFSFQTQGPESALISTKTKPSTRKLIRY